MEIDINKSMDIVENEHLDNGNQPSKEINLLENLAQEKKVGLNQEMMVPTASAETAIPPEAQVEGIGDEKPIERNI